MLLPSSKTKTTPLAIRASICIQEGMTPAIDPKQPLAQRGDIGGKRGVKKKTTILLRDFNLGPTKKTPEVH